MNQITPGEVARSFSKAAKTYDAAAFFQRIAGERLYERLDYFKLEPKSIVDLGCGTGVFTRELSQRFTQAQVTGVDIAEGMIQWCQQQSSAERYLCADAMTLPFPDNSVDLIFSNLAIQWVNDLSALFQELNRVLRPDGLLLFTTLGPDSLKELKQSFAEVDHYQHVNDFIDMHHVGDAMLNSQLSDPVVDAEAVVISYDKALELMRDLKDIGAHNIDSRRNSGLMGPNKLKAVEKAYRQFAMSDGKLPATYELIYGHAFGTEMKKVTDYHEYIVELAEGKREP
ncbi:malonyl-ACP O-methyltransferase BioC [Kangiella sediminilitoris]|uniref:Malonyl-[acyl-carrier protein] O-methyltransferase n=1 Tax=Kangiella sediminilitoris TaxID=1144748 RepID=A0A1B3B8P7_9GAMM|nr:malonyl-ACP O-methyltransferase BioC [Kangiella sediminilitoris]AOE49184.1 Malonyl-[acyl-carrier protein] O-methyltransferase [Kangiella sediminilitoris]